MKESFVKSFLLLICCGFGVGMFVCLFLVCIVVFCLWDGYFCVCGSCKMVMEFCCFYLCGWGYFIVVFYLMFGKLIIGDRYWGSRCVC